MILTREGTEEMAIGKMAKVLSNEDSGKYKFLFSPVSAFGLLLFFAAVLPLISVCHTSLGSRGVR